MNGTDTWAGIPNWAKTVAMVGTPTVFAIILLYHTLLTTDDQIRDLSRAISTSSDRQHQDVISTNDVLKAFIESNERNSRANSQRDQLLNRLVAIQQQSCIMAAKGNELAIERCSRAQYPVNSPDER